eukprot:PLAT5652.1.p1 GENE.PLAT5652.1~~PLAT5652.1.p1  ORF type:complete len:299 (-),score=128.54 PLAT5652.1:109-978(-)
MEVGDFDTTIKVIVVGNGQVGKTSLVTRFAKGTYDTGYKQTIGVDFCERTLELEETLDVVTLMIWDTAGQEEFHSLTSRYYKGAGAVALVFSTTNRASFEAIPRWKERVDEECGDVPMCIVQNKVDLIDEAEVSREEVEDMCRRLRMKLYRTSVKEKLNVDEVFEYLATRFIAKGLQSEDLGAVSAIGDLTASASAAKEEEAGGKDDDFASGKRGDDGGGKRRESSGGSSSGGVGRKPSTGGGATAGSGGGSASSGSDSRPARKKDAAFKLKPQVRRTGGKKAKPCTIM